MDRELLFEKILTDRVLKIGLGLWMVAAFFMLNYMTVRENMFYYLNDENLTTYAAPSIRAEVPGTGDLMVDLTLHAWQVEKCDIFGDLDFSEISRKAVTDSSSLPLSLEGFRNIVRADVTRSLLRASRLGHNDHFRVEVNIRKLISSN